MKSRLFFILSYIYACPQAEYSDVIHAIECARNDDKILWVNEYVPKRYCLFETNPYTIKIEFEQEQLSKILICQRPWRVFTWICEESNETCPPVYTQYFTDSHFP